MSDAIDSALALAPIVLEKRSRSRAAIAASATVGRGSRVDLGEKPRLAAPEELIPGIAQDAPRENVFLERPPPCAKHPGSVAAIHPRAF
jgi:hypothetical protein